MRLFLLLTLTAIFICTYGQNKAIVLPASANDSILIHSDVKDYHVKIIIDSLIFEGNKITHPNIILRELTFSENDTIRAYEFAEKLTKSRENLLNTSLFNFVTIHDSVVSDREFSHVHLHIHFIERWYLWPFPIFEISDRNFNSWMENKDFNRISYGLMLVKENMRGRMETLNLLLRFGWDETYQMSYNVPYFNKKQTFGSGFGLGFSQNHEVAYETVGNKPVTIRDNDESIYKQFYSHFNITFRHSFYDYHSVQINYNYFVFGDTLLQLNPDYSFNGITVNEYLSLQYRFVSDHRDSKPYPLRGHYFEGTLSKSGFGVRKDGDISMMEISGSYRKYFAMSKKLFFSSDWVGKISTSRNQPYFYQQGLGYGRNFVRGYELYVVDGQSYVLSKNTFKFNFVPTRVKEIGFIPTEKFSKIHYAFYLNWFIDAGYVDDFKNTEGNDLANRLLVGTGLGFDLVTYYDMVFRIEFSVNKEGEFGMFFHVANTL
ncbi:MAG: hypothetical protein K9H16_08025 [Bacteroidales bacterium]|nr:hypothetical protein [Bacteroidales bacterium]